MKLSVLMPVYNPIESEFRIAIESILNQTYKDFEFVIINDASTNNAKDVILSYNDDRIKYFENGENLNIIKTLNKGLDICQGEYIARMDQDDYCVETRLEKQVDYMDKYPNIGVLGSYFKILGEEKYITCPSEPEDVKYCVQYANMSFLHPSIMMRKSVLEQNNLRYNVHCKSAEDYRMISDIVNCSQGAAVKEVLVHYRISPGGISQSNQALQHKMLNMIVFTNIVRDFDCDKMYMFKILEKYAKNIPITEDEFFKFKIFLDYVVQFLLQHVSESFHFSIKRNLDNMLRHFSIYVGEQQ